MIIEAKLYVVPGEVKTSKKGIMYTVFSVKNKRSQVWKVICFGQTALDAKKKLNVINADVIIEGTEDKDGEDGDVRKIKANSFSLPGGQQTAIEKEIAKAGGQDAYARKAREETSRRYAAGERVVVKSGRKVWRPKEECIELNGKWYDKLEFCMNMMGGKKVGEIVKEEGVFFNNPQKYKKVMADILDLALSIYEEKKESV